MAKLTIKDVAREAGVSTATISRVINNSGYVSEDIKREVLTVIERLHYQPNAIARSLKQERSRTIGIVLPDMTNPYFMKIARAIQHSCVQDGYHLLFLDTEEDAGKEREALGFLLEKRIEALVVAGTGDNTEQLRAMQGAGVRVIAVDRRLPELSVDTVAEDNEAAAKLAIRHLLDRRHRRIAVLGGPQTIATARERRDGALSVMREAGLELRPEFICEGDYTRASGILAIRRLMSLGEPPTAVFSANNEMTFGLYLGLRELGIPRDSLEVVSFGELEFASLFRQKLTMLLQTPELIGAAVGTLLLRRLAEPEASRQGAPAQCIFMPKLAACE